MTDLPDQGQGPPVNIEDPTNDRRSNPYIYLSLYDGDRGEVTGRDAHAEYRTRAPRCVAWEDGAAILTITNSGEVASELVRVDFEFVFCTFSGHRLDEGFTVDHLAEFSASTIQDLLSVNFVPPRDSITLRIEHPQSPVGIANLFFRAYVSTLWSEPLDPAQWVFRDNPAATEATRRFV